VAGRGTLAPWSPPRHLVTSGLYQYSRNPMYVAVTLVLAGWTVGYESRALATYLAVVVVAFHLRVVFYEEPWLERTFGAEWRDYAARVPRWIGMRRRPDSGEHAA
jgi:protein-S-isoprenylcysteine O-methyltransferase Ste14